MKYIIGNWKANKSVDEVGKWVTEFTEAYQSDTQVQSLINSNLVRIIVCPSFAHLSLVQPLSSLQGISVGSQSISAQKPGSHTGEVTGEHLQGLAEFAIIGHSERRAEAHEDDQIAAEQVKRAQESSITPILCIRGQEDQIPSGTPIVAFEPVSAIGTGSNMPVDEVLDQKNQCALPDEAAFLYGGSVKPDTAGTYLQSSEIDGLLIGGASLDPASFLAIVRTVSSS